MSIKIKGVRHHYKKLYETYVSICTNLNASLNVARNKARKDRKLLKALIKVLKAERKQVKQDRVLLEKIIKVATECSVGNIDNLWICEDEECQEKLRKVLLEAKQYVQEKKDG